jgi:hypothetical protein
MFICLFWSTFDLVLSSMTVVPSFNVGGSSSRFSQIKDCDVGEVCKSSQCSLLFGFPPGGIPNPLDMSVSDSRGSFKISCSWSVGANASRFCCAIACIFMFIGIAVIIYRTPYPKFNRILYCTVFLAADAWWWAIMITDATMVIKSDEACKKALQAWNQDSAVTAKVLHTLPHFTHLIHTALFT